MDLFFRPKVQVEDFEAVAVPHFVALYRTARLLVPETAEAEDLVQDVYLHAWKSFHRFEPGTNCRAWLFKILFHRLHHFRRRWVKAAKMEAFENPEDQDSIPAEAPVPQEIRDEDVLNALEKVPVEFREVVLLADVQEFSYKEIAETMSVPLGTVMSRLSRGRKLLRQELAGVANSYGISPGKIQPFSGKSA
jgi:RNA polymerase sigma-70 factor, ECF subfamily